MKTEHDIPKRFIHLYQRLRSIRIPYKITFFVIGIASTVWFLIRVIPKPSRAGYPCMKAAAPFMSSFVIYLLSLTGSVLLFKHSGKLLRRLRYMLALAALAGAIVLFAISSSIFPERAIAGKRGDYIPSVDASEFPSNEPMGQEFGIFPGRVVWEWDPEATNENCTNLFDGPGGEPDGYFLAKNNDQEVIDRMMDDMVKKLTGTYHVGQAWEMLFKDFNQRKGRGPAGYQAGEKVFIKINQGGAGWLTRSSDLAYDENTNWRIKNYPNAETSGPMALALLKHLVEGYGILQEDIYIGDPNAHILKDNYDLMVASFPDVKYMDRDPQHAGLGRTIIQKASEPSLIWSDKNSVISPDGSEYSWVEVENADYLINLATLKAHARAGITLTAKNHFGTHARDQGAWPLHEGLVCKVDNDRKESIRNEYGVYRVLTDIMGHDKLGGNTVLFIVEGLWGGGEAVSKPTKWKSAPFNNDWPSSILASQDAVALESVCFDILRTEFNVPYDEVNDVAEPGRNRPWYGGVDDHLHQAADSRNWPEGFVYDPEGDGTPMGSMGVHEHWNNENERQYSRNLGYEFGIELIAPKELVRTAVRAPEAMQTPVIDGNPSDDCWEEATWNHIDETWINWGEEVDSADYFGRFKVTWSAVENLLYFLVEVTDDVFIDGYTFPNEGYHHFDIVEIFIDEDASGGLHAQDDSDTWGMNSENAFSYHLNADAPVDGSLTDEFLAMDLDGGWERINYAEHFPEFILKKEGDRYVYEFSLKVYDGSYQNSIPDDSRVNLAANKVMGLSMAYCDNDAPDGSRDNFFGSVWVPQADSNSHWMDADGFGRLRLVRGGSSINNAVEVTGAIEDFVIFESNQELIVSDKLLEIFNDPDGDILDFTVTCQEPALSFSITDTILKVTAESYFPGEREVTVTAYDGEYKASASFYISAAINQAVEVSGSIEEFTVTELGTNLMIHEDLKSVFTDPDGDSLSFSVVCSQAALEFFIDHDTLLVNASESFSGTAVVTVYASDGEYSAALEFGISAQITGLNQNSENMIFTCYPNPFSDLFHLELNQSGSFSGGGVILRVYDISGSEVFTQNLEGFFGGRGTATVDLSSLSKGFYFVKIETGTERYTRIVSKQ